MLGIRPIVLMVPSKIITWVCQQVDGILPGFLALKL
jgi:hypothetical protein